MHKAKGNPIDLSILGNPIPLRDEADRDADIAAYARHLAAICRNNPYIPKILRMIPDDAILGCFCYPKNCHCSVIIDACKFYK
jgi:hypothetical protein